MTKPERKPDLDMSKSRDAALLELHDLLAARHAPAPGSFSALSDAERRAYFTAKRRSNRGRAREAAAGGAVEPNTANARDALADAALMILATGGPGVDQVRMVLASVFHARAGAPMQIESRARHGKLKPKFFRRPA